MSFKFISEGLSSRKCIKSSFQIKFWSLTRVSHLVPDSCNCNISGQGNSLLPALGEKSFGKFLRKLKLFKNFVLLINKN